MALIIREYADLKRSKDGAFSTVLTEGALETDKNGVAIKSVANPATGVVVDSPRMESGTNFVEIQNTGAATVYYAVRPRSKSTTVLAATSNHRSIAAGSSRIEAVYGGAVINFLGG